MEILNKLADSCAHPDTKSAPVIAFIGDSVTQGCFDCFVNEKGQVATEFYSQDAYHSDLEKILAFLFKETPVTIVNAGISGTTARRTVKRLERDVLYHKPDLSVVCFGLNDCGGGEENLDEYGNSLKTIFTELQRIGSEVIFMTPNMMATRVSYKLKDKPLIDAAERCIKAQTGGMLEKYLDRAKQVAKECNVPVCDVYDKWKKLYAHGASITDYLSNSINHPSKEMHWMFAWSLLDTIINN